MSRHNNWLTQKLAMSFWSGPIDVFISWFRLNVHIDHMYTKEQIDTFLAHRGVISVHKIETPEELVALLTQLGKTYDWDLDPVRLTYGRATPRAHQFSWHWEEPLDF